MRSLTPWIALGAILLVAILIPFRYDRLVLKISPRDGPEITSDASRSARH